MGKLLRGLVVVFLILGIVAVVFASMLFGRRELLKGRTLKLERLLTTLADTFVEDKRADDEIPAAPTYPSKDVSPVTAELIDSPERSTFWDTYKAHLEEQDLDKMTVGQREDELRSYYLRDPVETYLLSGEHKILRDERGFKIIDGKGTMQYLLTEILSRAEEQYNRLNETREQLRLLREELINTITELNEEKNSHRESKKRIRELEAEIRDLKTQIRELENKIRDLELEIRTLQDEKTELQRELTVIKEERDTLRFSLKKSREEAEKYRKLYELEIGKGDITTSDELKALTQLDMPEGIKGEVIAVDSTWGFVVFKAPASFFEELKTGTRPLAERVPRIDLMVRRPGDTGAFVAKIRLSNVNPGQGLAVADIMSDWKIHDVQKGDLIFY